MRKKLVRRVRRTMGATWGVEGFAQRVQAPDDQSLLRRLEGMETNPGSYRPRALEDVRAEVARRELTGERAAPLAQVDPPEASPHDVARENMLAGVLFLLVSGLGVGVLGSTGWYDEADLVGGPLGTLGAGLPLKALYQSSRPSD
jgi:hypothetical protein